MINLKKMLAGRIYDKLKLICTKLLQLNVCLAYGGLDSINQHFSNKPIHTPFIEFIMIKKDFDKEAHFEQAKKESISFIMDEIQDSVIQLGGDPSCTITREILRECGSDGGYNGEYFVAHEETADRVTIDFYHDIVKNLSFQPFVEIRVLPNLQVMVLEKYGIFYIPLGFVAADIKNGVSTVGGADWTFRESTFKQCMERSGITLSSWTFNNLLKLCFPQIAMKRMRVASAVEEIITSCIALAPMQNNGAASKLKEVLLKELEKWQDDSILASTLTLETFYERCVILGFLPSNRDLKENIFNEYNRTHIREARTMNKIK